ncbi:MAG: hypothetical protein J5972_05915 [Eubacterium sp.]|nr:hypothetical protein [Eubacterium sp.]
MERKKGKVHKIHRILAVVTALALSMMNVPYGGMVRTAEAAEQIVIKMEQKNLDTIVPEYEGESNEELYEIYAAKTLGLGAGASMYSLNKAGDYLTGQDKIVYDVLKEYIEKAADGQLESAKFSIPIQKIINDEGRYYTAAELGVNSIGSNGSLSTEAANAMVGKLTYNSSSVFYALLTDCPYELYWFAKTVGMSRTMQTSYSATVNSSTGEYTSIAFNETSNITFCFSVDPLYQQSGKGEYSLDTTETGKAVRALNNAKKIVNDAAHLSDYEKLHEYKDIICQWNVYNSEAAEGSQNYGTCSPWQIIDVFDGDDATNVVCEGYSKAFAYLCELTKFRSSEIVVYTVSGYMSSDEGTNLGAHMWNVVHMSDGNNYLVDVTNCDDENVGTKDILFMQGYDNMLLSNGTDFAGYEIVVPRYYVTENSYYESWNAWYLYNDETMSCLDWNDLKLPNADFINTVCSEHQYDEQHECEVCGEMEEDWYFLDNYRSEKELRYPTKKGYVFAGWYSDESDTKPIGESVVTGAAHAKFVAEDVLTVKFQLPYDANAEKDTTLLRMLTSVDNLNYQSVGFEISYLDSESNRQTIEATSRTVYSELVGQVSERETQTYLPKDTFCGDAQYFMIRKLQLAKSYYDTPITITPKWTTLDGTVVSGTPRTFTLSESLVGEE